jgi:hypothetical protein
MSLIVENLPRRSGLKQQLRATLPEYKEIFRDVEAEMRRRVVADRIRRRSPGSTARTTSECQKTVSPGCMSGSDESACISRQSYRSLIERARPGWAPQRSLQPHHPV